MATHDTWRGGAHLRDDRRAGGRIRGAGAVRWLLLCAACTGCGVAARTQNAAGVRLYDQGQYPGAMQTFQQAVYNDPRSGDAYYNLAATLHKSGRQSGKQADLDQAESYYNQCLERSPDHRDCHRALAVLLCEEGRSDQAFRLVEGWSMRSPSLADPKVELARLFEEFGDKDAAKDHLLEALAVNPNDHRALAALGKLREETGDQAQALANYQRSLYLNRFQPEVAARVAALSPAYGRTMPVPASFTGTRTVQGASPSLRY